MARDLIYGKISRDWSCGSLLNLPSKQQLASDIRAGSEAGPLARVVESETQAAFQLAARLWSEKKLPAVERKAFRPTLQRWFALRDKRRGKFQGEDYVELVNLRDATRAYRKRLAGFARGQAPATPPTDPHSVDAKGLATSLLVAAGAAGLTLAIFSGLKK